jgi:hypothetical protein
MTQFVFKIGPVSSGQGVVNTYFVYPGAEGKHSFFGVDDRDVLAEIDAAYPGQAIECEPALASAGAAFGFGEGAFTPHRAHLLGMCTFDLALPGQLKAIEREGLIYQFGVACAKFWSASPWRFGFAQHTVEITFVGSIQRQAEARVLGAAGEEYGLMLYWEPSAIARVKALYDAGRVAEAAGIDTLGVTFGDEPAFAVDGMARAYGLNCLPVPLKVQGGERVIVDDVDLLLLASALQGLSALSDEGVDGSGHVKVSDLEAWAVVKPQPV